VEVAEGAAGSSCSRMGIAIGGGEPLTAHMGVALGGGHVGVAEQLLDRSKISAPIEEMRRERVPEGVGMGRRRRTPIEDAAHIARSEPATPLIAEQFVAGDHFAAESEPATQRIDRRLAEGNESLTRPLAPHPSRPLSEIERTNIERAELSDANTRAVQHLKHRVIPGPTPLRLIRIDRRLEQTLELVPVENARQTRLATRHLHPRHRVGRQATRLDGPTEIATQRRRFASDRTSRVLARGQIRHITPHRGACHLLRRRHAHARHPLGEQAQIGAIGLTGAIAERGERANELIQRPSRQIRCRRSVTVSVVDARRAVVRIAHDPDGITPSRWESGHRHLEPTRLVNEPAVAHQLGDRRSHRSDTDSRT
jgi:hypothetical protein